MRAGDVITIDGSTGEVILGEVATVTPELSGEFGELMKWADSMRRLEVRTNADTPHDAKVARDFGYYLKVAFHFSFGAKRGARRPRS